MFSAPLWLLALATLAIPLALHFWSRRPRDVIQVGSLRHVTEVSEARAWSARLTQPLLLALRLGILASVVLALAGPHIAMQPPSGSAQLVLVEPALLEDSTIIQADPLLDSLARSRATVRLLAHGLPKVQLDGIHPVFRAPGSPFRMEGGDWNPERGTIWELLASADRELSPREILLVARPQVTRLGGRRPSLAAKVLWHVPAAVPTPAWSAARWRTTDDRIISITGAGDVRGTSYEIRAASGSGCADCSVPPPLRVAIAGGDSLVTWRLGVAARAVALELGQRLTLAATPDSADLLITVPGFCDSLARPGQHLIPISRAVALGPGAADSLWELWPWSPLARDANDPRSVSLSQAAPGWRRSASERERDLRVPLLLLAALLLLVERWLSNRPTRQEA